MANVQQILSRKHIIKPVAYPICTGVPKIKASELKIPHLIVHGRRDAAVTIKEAGGLLLHPREAEVKMEILEGCGHSFGSGHPMTEPADCLIEACSLSSEWFKKTLKGKSGR